MSEKIVQLNKAVTKSILKELLEAEIEKLCSGTPSFCIGKLFLELYSHHTIPDSDMRLDILRRTRFFF